MEIIDYNGEGKWSCAQVVARYLVLAKTLNLAEVRDLSPREHVERERHWIYPVMDEVIQGIKANDPACVEIGIEFIEEDTKFVFGKLLKSRTARVLRRATLTEAQKDRIRRRVFAMLSAGHLAHELRDYSRLAATIGFSRSAVPERFGTSARIKKFFDYFESQAS